MFYHFICEGSCETLYPILKTYPNGNGDVGSEIVTVFFLISGALLFHNHPIISSKKIFYKKRWLNLFPTFYIAYGSIFLIRALTGKSPMKGKELGLFPLTLVGFDGYLAAYTGFKDWYILGEWFLGAIILCYLLYPLFIKFINSHEVEFYIAISSLYFVFMDVELLRQDAFRNVFSCIFSFAIGMAIDKHKLYEKKGLLLISVLIWCMVCFLPFERSSSLTNHLAGIGLFFILYYIGKVWMKNRIISMFFSEISKVSYEIFLIQHIIICFILNRFDTTNVIQTVAILIVDTIITFIAAEILHFVVKVVLNGFRGLKIS